MNLASSAESLKKIVPAKFLCTGKTSLYTENAKIGPCQILGFQNANFLPLRFVALMYSTCYLGLHVHISPSDVATSL